MGGFTDHDWGPSGGARRRRRAAPSPAADREIFTATVALARNLATDPAHVELAKEKLYAQATAHLDRYGYIGTGLRWLTDPPGDPADPIVMRLEVDMVPRDDGEWASIREAIRQDEEDRAAAAEAAATVGDRLDALKRATALWSNRDLTDACRSAGRAAASFSGAFEEMGRTAARATDGLRASLRGRP